MPRSNRPRGRQYRPDEVDAIDLARAVSGWRRTETRRGASYNVQPVTESQALKAYRCPGCALEVAPGVAHLVVWRADGVLGDERDLAERRHWHTHCWKVA
jgi:hypothetical protein